MTGLPVAEEGAAPTAGHGTIAELLSLKKSETAKVKPPKPEETSKEKKLDEVDKKLQEMLFRGKPKKKKAADEEEAIAEPGPEEEPPAPAPAPAKQPAPAKKAAPVKDRAAELRERELALEKERLELEREKLELQKAASKPAQQPQPKVDVSALSEDERQDLEYQTEVFKAMAKMDNSKYGGLATKYTEAVVAESRYKQQWEKDHPGEVFDPEDGEHDAFFSKNQVRYDKKDFKKAEAAIANEDNPKLDRLEKSNQELMAKEKLRELEPKATQVWLRHVDAMLEAIDPSMAKSARTGGKDQIVKDFPEEYVEVFKAAAMLESVSREAHKILDGGGLFAPQLNNDVHQFILNRIRNQERIIPQQPRDERIDPDGRDFATWEQWVNMSPQQQSAHWHLGPEEIVDMLSHELAVSVKSELERIDKIAEARKKRLSGAQNGNGHPHEEVEITPPRRSPSASPGAASKTTVDTPAKVAVPADDKFAKMIRSKLFQRSS